MAAPGFNTERASSSVPPPAAEGDKTPAPAERRGSMPASNDSSAHEVSEQYDPDIAKNIAQQRDLLDGFAERAKELTKPQNESKFSFKAAKKFGSDLLSRLGTAAGNLKTLLGSSEKTFDNKRAAFFKAHEQLVEAQHDLASEINKVQYQRSTPDKVKGKIDKCKALMTEFRKKFEDVKSAGEKAMSELPETPTQGSVDKRGSINVAISSMHAVVEKAQRNDPLSLPANQTIIGMAQGTNPYGANEYRWDK